MKGEDTLLENVGFFFTDTYVLVHAEIGKSV